MARFKISEEFKKWHQKELEVNPPFLFYPSSLNTAYAAYLKGRREMLSEVFKRVNELEIEMKSE
jgi:hypothetical protein